MRVWAKPDGVAGFARNKDGSTLGVNGYETVAPGYNQAGFAVGMRQKF